MNKIGCLVSLSLLLLLSGCTSEEQVLYDQSINAFESKDYQVAIDGFGSLENYKDSAVLLEESKICLYNSALDSISQDDFDTAISYLTGLSYEDSEELLNHCTIEKGMHENADYRFLEALERSLEERTENVYAGISIEKIVQAEIINLEPFLTENFYDDTIQELFLEYHSALLEQQSAFSNTKFGRVVSEYQIPFYSGSVRRFEVIHALQEKYNWGVDNKTIQLNYSEEELNKLTILLDALVEIESDLVDQLAGVVSIYKNNHTQYIPYTNNSGYDFAIEIYFKHYDDNGTQIDNVRTEVYSHIEAGETINLEYYSPEESTNFEYYWAIAPIV